MEILEESVNAIEMAKKIDPTMPALYAAQGRNFIAEGNYARALEQFQKSLDLVPGSPVAIYYIGICYIYLGDWDKAIENLNKRSEMDIKEVQPDLRLAMIYDYLRNYPNAIKYYDRVAGFNPAHVFAPFGLADISMKR